MTHSDVHQSGIAIIGAGFISDYHVRGLRSAGATRIGPLVGRSPERTRKRADELGIDDIETDLARVLDNPSIDGVVIASPDDTHHDIAIGALDAGKAVLVQKPMALDSDQCRSIIAASERSTAALTVSFMHRHFPEVRWLKEQLAAGIVGDVHSVRIRNATPGADWADWFYNPGAVAGGVVMQLGIHGIDLIQHLFGPVDTLIARTATMQPERQLADGRMVAMPLEDTATAVYTLASGATVTHEMSYIEIAGCDRFRLEVYGTKGTVWLRTERGPATVFAPDVNKVSDWVVPAIADEPLGSDHHAHWLRIVAGQAPCDDTPQAGLRSMVVAETLYRAAETGSAQSVPAE